MDGLRKYGKCKYMSAAVENVSTKKERVYGQNVVAVGCRFHFAQAVVRKAKKIGLSSAFRDDAEASKCIL